MTVGALARAVLWPTLGIGNSLQNEVGALIRALCRKRRDDLSAGSTIHDKIRHFPFVASCQLRRLLLPSTLGPFLTRQRLEKGGFVTHFVRKLPCRNLVLSTCVLLAVLPSATARTVTVDCDKTTISNALKTLDPQASNTIKVTGTCRDSIGINDFADLSIVGENAGSQKATIKSLNGGPIFWIVASHVQ